MVGTDPDRLPVNYVVVNQALDLDSESEGGGVNCPVSHGSLSCVGGAFNIVLNRDIIEPSIVNRVNSPPPVFIQSATKNGHRELSTANPADPAQYRATVNCRPDRFSLYK
jgi:hypothetical protein